MGHVLIIEDYPIHRDLMARWLARWGYTVVAVRDAVEGLAYAMLAQPDLVLMDIQLPGMSGLEATRRLKVNPATAHMRIIALTACTQGGEPERCLAAGCDDFESKPVDFVRLRMKLKALDTPRPAAVIRGTYAVI